MQVAVIGAGAAGLVTALELRREGLHPTVLERAPRPGGTWIYDPQPGPDHGPLYASLRTNLPRDLMAFDDLPFVDQGAGDPRRFPGHAEVHRYLDAFARAFDLVDHVRFGCTVTELSPRDAHDGPWRPGLPPPASWRLRWREATGVHEARFDAVAVCNGHYHEPRVPALPGLDAFGGRVLHSHDYREPSAFAGLSIALLGAKASGLDLSLELATVARRVILCGRGLPRTDHRGPRGVLCHRPPITALEPHALHLADGTRETGVDALLLCTGYRYALPFLHPTGPLELDDSRPFPLHLDLVSAHAPTLALVGLPFQIVPFPLMARQARLWARALVGPASLPAPAQMLALAGLRDARFAAAGVPLRHRLRYGPAQWPYCAHLARLAGDPPPPPWREELNRLVSQARRDDPAGYRDRPFPPSPGWSKIDG
ncbi:MAG: NAD(P)-binding protein [Myxococcales bacterium]|nr:NAD(P)-binding protein [Myxococcales bacterium]